VSWTESFVLTFVPLFIVIDAIGNLPFVVSLSEGLTTRERRNFPLFRPVYPEGT
jgi:small neutral amino acid transporter SnatA (MarC family)